MLERLRCGTPPHEGLSSITLGHRDLSEAVGEFLSKSQPDRRILWVQGPYGSGKSHSLAAVREIAHELCFATCFVSADGIETALNHPQRLIPALLRHFEMPAVQQSYAALVERLASTTAQATRLLERVVAVLDTECELDIRARSLAREVVRERISSEVDAEDEAASAVAELVRLLAGMSIASSACDRTTRQKAYRLLRLAQDLARQGGARGIVVAIDEGESIFTKLQDIRSRRGAYRTLSALGYWTDLPDIRVVCALTPDVDALIKMELPSEMRWVERLRGQEPTDRLVDDWSAKDRRVWRCRPVGSRDLDRLLQTICAMYGHAHGFEPDVLHDRVRSVTERFRKHAEGTISPRMLVRDVVDRLDLVRFA